MTLCFARIEGLAQTLDTWVAFGWLGWHNSNFRLDLWLCRGKPSRWSTSSTSPRVRAVAPVDAKASTNTIVQ